MNREQLRDAILALPAEERADLLDEIVLSLPVDPQVEQAWKDEVSRRVEDIESGRVKGIPAREALSELRRRLGGED